MKKLLATAGLLVLTATAVYAMPSALPGTGVLNSVHDMNAVDGLIKDPQGRVCAFCHTPHHALDAATNGLDYNPLWSHNVTTMAVITPYASSTFDAGGAVEPLAGPTKLCMSCHDGAIAPDQHYGALFAGTAALGGKFQSDGFGGIAVGLNGDFSNDHPLGFDVNNVGADVYDAATNPTGGIFDFWTDQDAATALKFFDVTNVRNGAPMYKGLYPIAAGAPGSIFTCATCHDVHNQDNVVNTDAFSVNHLAAGMNYLVYAPQSGSMLCLSCHNK